MAAGRVPFRTADSSRSADRTDALWAEMQATLEEVEVSASGGTTIFGHEHDRKLEQLRAAQIALAQAWARSEADDAIETREGASTVAGGGAGTAAGGGGAGAMSGVTGDEMRPLAKSVGGDQAGPDVRSTTGGTTSIPRPGSSGRTAEKLGARLEEETKADILLARRRREANDQYFERVSGGVLDVIAKLEEVAKAMTAVEQESKSVWNDDDSTGNGRH
jgi:septum formation topological specificity factor MinE